MSIADREKVVSDRDLADDRRPACAAQAPRPPARPPRVTRLQRDARRSRLRTRRLTSPGSADSSAGSRRRASCRDSVCCTLPRPLVPSDEVSHDERTILLLPGDGVGPEVSAAAARCCARSPSRFGHQFTGRRPIGGAALRRAAAAASRRHRRGRPRGRCDPARRGGRSDSTTAIPPAGPRRRCCSSAATRALCESPPAKVWRGPGRRPAR